MSRLSIFARAIYLTLVLASAGAEAQADGVTADQVAALASEHSPALKASLLELESARWDVNGREAQYAPVLVLDASATRGATPSLVLNSININRVERVDSGAELRKRLIWGTDLSLRVSGNYLVTSSSAGVVTQAVGEFGPLYGLSAKLALKQPLLRGRGRDVGEAELLASRVRRTAQEHARDRVASQLLRDALTAYWELWYASAALRIEEQSREVSVRQRDDASARAATGTLAPADVLAFETQVASREESVLNAQVLAEQRELELLRQLGLVETGRSLSASAEEAPLVSVPPREVATRRALAEASELRELETQVELSRLQSKTAADPQRGRLDLDSYVQTQGLGNKDAGDAVEQFGGLGVLSAFVGLTYEAPLNDRAERATVARARIAVEVAEQQLLQARQRVLSEVELTLERQAAGERKVALAEHTLSIAERQLAAQQARFASGAATSLSVLEAEDTVRSARTRVARARADVVQSALALEHLTGGLLQRYAALTRR